MEQIKYTNTIKRDKEFDGITLVEHHVVKPSDKFYDILSDYCVLSRNLYNHANYILRHQFFNKERLSTAAQLKKRLKVDKEYPDFKVMKSSHTAFNTLKRLREAWASYFNKHENWEKNPNQYNGEPGIPKYRKKTKKGFSVYLDYQVSNIRKDGLIHFPRILKGFKLKPYFTENEETKHATVQMVEIKPTNHNYIEINVAYRVSDKKPELKENERYLGIDIGIDNLIAVGNNFGQRPFLINGKGLKSINQDFNRRLAHYQSIIYGMNASTIKKTISKLDEESLNKIRQNLPENTILDIDLVLPKNRIYRKRKLKRMYKKGIKIKRLENIIQRELIDEGRLMPYSSKMISSLYKNRTFRIRDYMHKASKILIDYAIEHNVSTIIIGRNKNWKQDLKGKMYHTTIQNFTKIPHYKLIRMIEYKAMLAGIKVVKVNESYTSGTSFLDNERPIKSKYDKSRRKHRGLFVSNEGIKINADVNAAMQIIRKFAKNENIEKICKEYPNFKREICITEKINIPYTEKKRNLKVS